MPGAPLAPPEHRSAAADPVTSPSQPAPGDELFSPIDKDTWDVVVTKKGSEADTPEARRVSGASSKKFQKKKAAVPAAAALESDDPAGSDDSDFLEQQPPAARKRGAKKSTPDDASKRRKLDYDRTSHGEGGEEAEAVGGSAKAKRGKGRKSNVKQEDEPAKSDDDFACMQPKKTGKSPGKGKSKGGGASSKDKEPVYVCERGCGYEGSHEVVEAHEQVCGYVRGDQWESDMDEDEEEEFLAKWEASVERKLKTTR